jgi:hypothetical protein
VFLEGNAGVLAPQPARPAYSAESSKDFEQVGARVQLPGLRRLQGHGLSSFRVENVYNDNQKLYLSD